MYVFPLERFRGFCVYLFYSRAAASLTELFVVVVLVGKESFVSFRYLCPISIGKTGICSYLICPK